MLKEKKSLIHFHSRLIIKYGLLLLKEEETCLLNGITRQFRKISG